MLEPNILILFWSWSTWSTISLLWMIWTWASWSSFCADIDSFDIKKWIVSLYATTALILPFLSNCQVSLLLTRSDFFKNCNIYAVSFKFPFRLTLMGHVFKLPRKQLIQLIIVRIIKVFSNRYFTSNVTYKVSDVAAVARIFLSFLCSIPNSSLCSIFGWTNQLFSSHSYTGHSHRSCPYLITSQSLLRKSSGLCLVGTCFHLIKLFSWILAAWWLTNMSYFPYRSSHGSFSERKGFIEMETLVLEPGQRFATLLERGPDTGVFLWILRNF